MTVTTDHFRLQGHSLLHLEKGCQDYSYSFTTKAGLSVALVSDGCSSANNSDIGSVQMVLAASAVIADWFPYRLDKPEKANSQQLAHEFESLLLIELQKTYDWHRRSPFLDEKFLDATLVLAATYKGLSYVFMFGDGHFTVDYDDDTFELYSVDSTAALEGVEHSMPNYLAYQVGSPRLPGYLALNPLREFSLSTYHAGQWGEEDKIRDYRVTTPITLCIEPAAPRNLRSITVSSDGIGTFNNLTTRQAALQLYRYPADSKGVILRRKMLFNSTRTWPKAGITHHDDLGAAAIIWQK